MGYTKVGEARCLYEANKVVEGEIISNEKGSDVPWERSCPLCWFFGERMVCRSDDGGMVLSILQKGEDMFFCDPDTLIPSSVMSGAVCSAGLRTDNDAIKLTAIQRPCKRSCYQHRTCPPG